MSLLFVPLGHVCTGLYHILRHLVRGIRDVKTTITTHCYSNLMGQHSVLACLHSYSQYSSKLLIRYIGLSKIMHKYKYRFCIWQYIWRLSLSQTTLESKQAITTKYSTCYRIASHIGTRRYLTLCPLLAGVCQPEHMGWSSHQCTYITNMQKGIYSQNLKNKRKKKP